MCISVTYFVESVILYCWQTADYNNIRELEDSLCIIHVGVVPTHLLCI